jgi:hypothetical protein
VEYFFIGKQKVVLFPKYRENDWESAASALNIYLDFFYRFLKINHHKIFCIV